MKICFFCGHFPPAIGGAEFATYHLANHLSQQGVKVVVQATRRSDRKGLHYPFAVRNWHSIPFVSSSIKRQSHVLLEKLISGFDLIHAVSTYEPGYFAAQLKNVIKTPLVITSQGSDVQVVPELEYGFLRKQGASQKLKFAFERVDALIAVSSKNKNDLLKAGAPSDLIYIIHNGCEYHKIRQICEQVNVKRVHQRYGISDSDFVVISVGRNSPVKGLDYLLSGIKTASQIIPDLKCILVGPKGQLENKVKKMGLSNQVVLIGRIPPENSAPQKVLETPYTELIELYNCADVYINGSFVEAFSITVMDAMACGLPVVITSTSGNVDLVREGKEGFTYQPKDMDAFVQKLLLLYNHKESRLSMGKNGQQQASLWDWSIVARKHVEIYDSVLKRYNETK